MTYVIIFLRVPRIRQTPHPRGEGDKKRIVLEREGVRGKKREREREREI